MYIYILHERKKSNNNKINTDQGGIGVTIVVKKNKYFFNYWKNKFKYSLIKDPSETSSLEYIKQQI